MFRMVKTYNIIFCDSVNSMQLIIMVTLLFSMKLIKKQKQKTNTKNETSSLS